MKATQLLIRQHKEVAALFKSFEEADADQRAALFEEIGSKLAAHDAIEREIFYPACKEALGETGEELLGEALVEHGVVEFSIYKADIADDTTIAHCVKVLADIVEHHVEEEEEELFPLVEKAMKPKQLEELGAAMEARFDAALEEEFRVAVRANLEQVLAGAVETEPAGAEGEAAEEEDEEDEDEDDEDDDDDDDDSGEGEEDAEDEVAPKRSAAKKKAKASPPAAKKTAAPPTKVAAPAKKTTAKKTGK